MGVNGEHLLRAHHLPCLSGLSQVPLIPPSSSAAPGDSIAGGAANGSEGSTPSSAQSGQLHSPSKLLQHQLASGTPSSSKPKASIFFPPPPMKPNPMLQPNPSKRSPRTPDINMNAPLERNREQAAHLPTASPRAPASAHSSTTFFPELVQPRSAGPSQSAASKALAGRQSWSHQPDENYHFYHEPTDPDAEPSPKSQLVSPDSPASASRVLASSASNDHINTIQLPPLPRSANVTPISANSAFLVPSSPTVPKGERRSFRFADRASSGQHQADDVSEHIYLCYVTSKSNERANQASRSYHGPKSCHSQDRISNRLPLNFNSGRNLSSPSVADLPLSPSNLPASMVPLHFRDHCVRELIETETNYVHALEMIIKRFGRPIEGLLKRDEYQLIFGHIKYFHTIHSTFQADLVKAALKSYHRDVDNSNPSSPLRKTSTANQTASNPATPTIVAPFVASTSPLSSPTAHNVSLSSCFLNAKDKFLKYGDYCAALSRAQELLDELTSKNELLAAQLDRCQHDANEGKFKLRDLLSLPMQRILKYHLLLAQLIKNTSKSNDDYQGLKKAHETMVDLGQFINEVKRDTEAIQIINEIEKSITNLNMPLNTQLTDYGRLVTDGVVRLKVPADTKTKPVNDAKQKQKRYVFVFDKVMLVCKEGVRGYQYKEAIVLSEYTIDPNPALPQGEAAMKQAAKDKWSYNFNLVKFNDKFTYSFYAKTFEMKNRWVDAIQSAMDNTRPIACRNNETNHEFLMHTFDKATSCDHCGKLLHGLYYQGYRCKVCFASAHKKCLTLIRPCGPILPAKTSNTIARGRCNEPQSPSVRSNCSDDSGDVFMNFRSANSSSTPCVDSVSRIEYSNMKGGVCDLMNHPNSSFRENGNRVGLSAIQRPVSSMVNVSSQHPNKLLHHESPNWYVNFKLDDQPWFCGRMERDKAQSILEEKPHGTFLVRVSPKHNGSYVISLNYNNQVKHMRIYVSKDNQLYLSQNRYFKSVIELVSWYERNSLVESFHMLDAYLAIPYKPALQL